MKLTYHTFSSPLEFFPILASDFQDYGTFVGSLFWLLLGFWKVLPARFYDLSEALLDP